MVGAAGEVDAVQERFEEVVGLLGGVGVGVAVGLGVGVGVGVGAFTV